MKTTWRPTDASEVDTVHTYAWCEDHHRWWRFCVFEAERAGDADWDMACELTQWVPTWDKANKVSQTLQNGRESLLRPNRKIPASSQKRLGGR